MEDFLNYVVYIHVFWYWAIVSTGTNMLVWQSIEGWKPCLRLFIGLSFVSKVVINSGYFVALDVGFVPFSFETRFLLRGILNTILVLVMISLCVYYGKRMIFFMKWTHDAHGDNFLTVDSSDSLTSKIRFFTRFLLVYTILEVLQLCITWAEVIISNSTTFRWFERLQIYTNSASSLVISLERVGVLVMFNFNPKSLNFSAAHTSTAGRDSAAVAHRSVDTDAYGLSVDRSTFGSRSDRDRERHERGWHGRHDPYESSDSSHSIMKDTRDAICLDNHS